MHDDTPDFDPLHAEVCRDLMGKIHTGKIEPGYFLPGPAELAEDYGVSIATARRGLRLLRDLGWTHYIPELRKWVAALPS
jgi:DNA-binding GntR family transcriptional regulator